MYKGRADCIPIEPDNLKMFLCPDLDLTHPKGGGRVDAWTRGRGILKNCLFFSMTVADGTRIPCRIGYPPPLKKRLN